MHETGPQGPEHYVFSHRFWVKNLKNSAYSSILIPENMRHYDYSESGQCSRITINFGRNLFRPPGTYIMK